MVLYPIFIFLTLCGVVMAKPESQVMIGFLFFALVLGAVINLSLSRFAPRVPYTVVVFAVGVAISFIFSTFPNDNTMKQSENLWNNFEPELLLFVFLPVLLFGEAMSLNFYHVKRALIPSAILAGPGVLFGTFSMALVMKYLLPYGWDWNLCFVFGSILSATDPVAAVALLKSVGASHGITYLIIGESLMNDGTALVLFGLFRTLVKTNAGPVFSILDVAIFFLRVIFISPLLGIAFGLASVLFLASANHRMNDEDTIVQMAITVCCAYLSFFVAEYVVGVSGVLCCCAAALTLSCYAQPLFLKPEAIHTVWGAFEWIGNTLIFTFAGLIIGSRTLVFVSVTDIGYIVVVYIFTFVIRAFTLLLCYPLLCLPVLGKPTSAKEAIFMTWAGMRGAVSMALALSLLHSAENGDVTVSRHDSHIVFFLVGGEVALNLLINATTAAPLLEYLRLIDTEQTAERVMMFNFVRKRIRVKAAELLDQLKLSRPDQIDVDLVTSYCSILRTYESDTGKHSHIASFDDRDSETHSHPHSHPLPHSHSLTDIRSPDRRGSAEGLAMATALARRSRLVRRNSDIVHDDAEELHTIPETFARAQQLPALMSRIRTAFLEVVRVSYKQQISVGKLPRNATCVRVLLNSVEAALERVEQTGLLDWSIIESTYAGYFTALMSGVLHTGAYAKAEQDVDVDAGVEVEVGVERATKDHLARLVQEFRDAQVIYMLTSFIDAHHYAQKRIPYYLGQTYSIDTPEEARVVQESREAVVRAKAYLAAMDPRVVTVQVSKQTARWILHRQEDQVEEFQQQGIISEADAETLLHLAATDLRLLGQLEWSEMLIAMGERVSASLHCLCPDVTSEGAAGGGGIGKGEGNIELPVGLSRRLARTSIVQETV